MVVETVRLIANPVAGRDAPARIEAAERHLRRRGVRVDLCLTRERGDARRLAAEAAAGGFGRIIAAGGDGTLNEVVNGLAPSGIPLAFLPLGTTNVFALETGIPFDVEPACDLALDGLPQPVCLGLAGATRFLLMAGIGYDAEVVYRVSGPVKRWAGKGAYLLSGLTTFLRRSPAPIELEREDGSVVRGYGAVLGNSRLYGGRFTLTPAASLTEPALEVCLFLRPGRLSLLRCAAAVAAGRPLPPPLAERFKARRLTVRGAGVPVQIDGDFLGHLPMTFSAVPGELNMILPGPAKSAIIEHR